MDFKLKPIIAAKAKKNLTTHTSDGYQGCQKSDKAPIDTKKEVAKAAGVSHDTIAKVEKIEAQATPEIKAALRRVICLSMPLTTKCNRRSAKPIFNNITFRV